MVTQTFWAKDLEPGDIVRVAYVGRGLVVHSLDKNKMVSAKSGEIFFVVDVCTSKAGLKRLYLCNSNLGLIRKAYLGKYYEQTGATGLVRDS